jgi:hypothetical protein
VSAGCTTERPEHVHQNKRETAMNKDDLQNFCCPGIPGLSRPWSRDIYTFASNGHILIRVKRLDDIPDNPEAPKTFHLWPKDIPPFIEIPDFPEPEFTPCVACNGTGRISCTGDVCEECDGDKKDQVIVKVKVGICLFSNHYLAMIKKLPGLQFAPPEKDTLKPAYFLFYDGDGLLMPMKQ